MISSDLDHLLSVLAVVLAAAALPPEAAVTVLAFVTGVLMRHATERPPD